MVVLVDSKIDFTGTLEEHAEITTSNMLLENSDADRQGPWSDDVGGHPALRYEVTGEIDLTRVVFLQTTGEGADAFCQVLGWPVPSKEAAAGRVINEVTDSFRLVDE